MYHKDDLTGKTIGDWTVIRPITGNNPRFRYFLCRCKCGTEKPFTVSYINTGRPSSCESCRAKKRLQQEEDMVRRMVGSKRGDYTIVRPAEKTRWGSRRWLCRCKCGRETVYTTGQILSRGMQRTRCERCYSEDMELSNRVTNHIPERFWKRLQDSANRRGILFSLTREEAYSRYEAQKKCCALTGKSLYFTRLRTRFNRYTNASIDRIDPDKGYFPDNIQWVHKTVNMMKGSLSQAEMLEWCRAVTENATKEVRCTPTARS